MCVYPGDARARDDGGENNGLGISQGNNSDLLFVDFITPMRGFNLNKLSGQDVMRRLRRRNDRPAVFVTVCAFPQRSLEDVAAVTGAASHSQVSAIQPEAGRVMIEVGPDRRLGRRHLGHEHGRDQRDKRCRFQYWNSGRRHHNVPCKASTPLKVDVV